MSLIEDKHRLIKFLPGHSVEAAFAEFRELAEQYARSRSATKVSYWVSGVRNPVSDKAPTLEEVLQDCRKAIRLNPCFSFHWSLETKDMGESWTVFLYFTAIPHFDCAFDVGAKPLEIICKELVNSGAIDVAIEPEHDEYIGSRAGLYIFHKISCNRRLRGYLKNASSSIDNGSSFSGTSSFERFFMDDQSECVTLKNDKRELNALLRQCDHALANSNEVHDFLTQFRMTRKDWLELKY